MVMNFNAISIVILLSVHGTGGTTEPFVFIMEASETSWDNTRVIIKFESTLPLVIILPMGEIKEKCSFCPDMTPESSEMRFAEPQKFHLQDIRIDGARFVHVIYTFYISSNRTTYTVEHVTNIGKLYYNSSDDSTTSSPGCSLPLRRSIGRNADVIVKSASNILKRWIGPYKKTLEFHQKKNVRAQFWETKSENRTVTLCALYSSSPFSNIIRLFAEGFETFGSTGSMNNQYISLVVANSSRSYTCEIISPTGWTITLKEFTKDFRHNIGVNDTFVEDPHAALKIIISLCIICGVSVCLYRFKHKIIETVRRIRGAYIHMG